jgi:hypothetical protein
MIAKVRRRAISGGRAARFNMGAVLAGKRTRVHRKVPRVLGREKGAETRV